MELKPCPVCQCKPLLYSEDEVMCVNVHCSVHGKVTKKRIWNIRAEIVSRDSQILKELVLEHTMKSNLEKIRMRFSGNSE